MVSAAGWKLGDVRLVDNCVRAGSWLHVLATPAESVPLLGPLLQRTMEYHHKTSLGPGGRAKNGSMDWSKQPDKFLRFKATAMVDLPVDGGSWVARTLRYAFG